MAITGSISDLKRAYYLQELGLDEDHVGSLADLEYQFFSSPPEEPEPILPIPPVDPEEPEEG